jgi:hypothetical protein
MRARWLSLALLRCLISASFAGAMENGNDEDLLPACREPSIVYGDDYPDGKPKSRICFRDGEPNSLAKSWYPDGKLKSEGSYLNGQMNGEWRRFFESGALKDQGRWKNGKPRGEWKRYKADGEVHGRLLCGDSSCSEDAPHTVQSSWLSFRLEPLYVRQQDGGESYSFALHYSPALRVSRLFSLIGDIGAFPLRDADQQNRFPVVQGALSLGRHFGDLRGEVGWGGQVWLQRSQSASVFVFTLGWETPVSKLDSLRMIYLGLTTFNYSNSANEYRVGTEWVW